MGNNLRIGLLGCPGSGKTTVASKLAEELNIPFLSSRSITQQILDRDKFDFVSGMYVEKFLATKHREFELVENKISIENKSDSFVTDRTTLEQFAYALLEIHQYDDNEIKDLQKKCQNHLKTYTHLFYFKRSDDIKKNGIRTTNKWFQMKVDYLIMGLIKEWGIGVYEVKGDVSEIVSIIGKY